jgi:hypothetical protein
MVLLLALVFWIYVRETWILTFGMVAAIIQCIGVLSIPLTSPQIYEKLGLKW